MKGYKLTDGNGQTRRGTQWGENVTHRAREGELEFCSDTAIHFYSDPLLADFCNPIHGDFTNPILWEGEAKGETKTDGLKSICKEFTTIKQIPLPKLTKEQKIEVGIRCALKVCKDKGFVEWANKWLSREDRSEKSAYGADAAYTAAGAYAANAAAAAAYATAYATAYTTDYAAANAAARAAADAAAYINRKKLNLLEIVSEVQWKL